MNRRLPNFLIIGEQKCGTTSLNRMLSKHPNIFVPTKEVHFYDRYFQNGLTWYKNRFNDADKRELCGEKTPNYLFFRECLDRIKDNQPNIKMIIMLREPAARAVSYYRSNKNIYVKNFFDAVEKGIEIINGPCTLQDYNEFHFVQRGIYYDSIKYCLDLFPKDNIRIIPLEQFIKTPQKYLNMLQNFLNVKRKRLRLMKVNTAKRKDKTSEEEKDYLKIFYKEHNEKLFELLGYKIKEWA